ncbi:alkaline phosphatase family protein [Lichenibacterium minor]|uniref:Alkaline phosphatase family protein n=1 Tax=Lichenibacterium minor TaxID=2316528 RepID=A0A4Q2UDU1_9HYPH|nr:alkaline phosphatase family protein [Lichenibacterium minor]RYC32975.1 alkaline phosphatase family protein [Lichenibacterium minor]
MTHYARAAAGAAALALLSAAAAAEPAPYAHVLLISVDGLHALDLSNYAASHPDGALARLARGGTVYRHATTPLVSDSFPGFAAQVTGGGPATTGIYYDDSYDRSLFPPGSACRGEPGTEVPFASEIDVDTKRSDAGGTVGRPLTQIDAAKLPLRKDGDACTPVYPHDYLRVNTVFEVAHRHGGRTAWSDKHPAYEWLGGPSGQGLDELYEIEQDALIPGTKVKTTGSFAAERDFDGRRVAALLNMMRGLDGAGGAKVGVPALFGMNFQAVSVGQKLPKGGPGDAPDRKGGYADASGTPNDGLAEQLAYVDGALGDLVEGLKDNGLQASTLVVVSAKHGQSPIDPAALKPTDDAPLDKVPGHAFHDADDGALIWLKPAERAAALPEALAFLQAHRGALGIGTIYPPAAVASLFADPATDSRAPDIVLGTDPGVVFTSGKKIAEHGGMSLDDRAVALVVSGPGVKAGVVDSAVATAQIAPTILAALGYATDELQAVKAEGTPVLPGLPFPGLIGRPAAP